MGSEVGEGVGGGRREVRMEMGGDGRKGEKKALKYV